MRPRHAKRPAATILQLCPLEDRSVPSTLGSLNLPVASVALQDVSPVVGSAAQSALLAHTGLDRSHETSGSPDDLTVGLQLTPALDSLDKLQVSVSASAVRPDVSLHVQAEVPLVPVTLDPSGSPVAPFLGSTLSGVLSPVASAQATLDRVASVVSVVPTLNASSLLEASPVRLAAPSLPPGLVPAGPASNFGVGPGTSGQIHSGAAAADPTATPATPLAAQATLSPSAPPIVLLDGAPAAASQANGVAGQAGSTGAALPNTTEAAAAGFTSVELLDHAWMIEASQPVQASALPLPMGADQLAAMSFDVARVAQDVRQAVQQLESLAQQFWTLMANLGGSPWVLALFAGLGAYEVQRRSQRALAPVTVTEDGGAPWLPGLQ